MELVGAVIFVVAIVQTAALSWALSRWAAHSLRIVPSFSTVWYLALFLLLNIVIVLRMATIGEVVAAMLFSPVSAFALFATVYALDVRYIRKHGHSFWRML